MKPTPFYYLKLHSLLGTMSDMLELSFVEAAQTVLCQKKLGLPSLEQKSNQRSPPGHSVLRFTRRFSPAFTLTARALGLIRKVARHTSRAINC